MLAYYFRAGLPFAKHRGLGGAEVTEGNSIWRDLSHLRASAPDISGDQERAKGKDAISYNTSKGEAARGLKH